MDAVLQSLVNVIQAGGTAAIWVAVGWFGHKILITAIISFAVVNTVSKVVDAIMSRVILNGFVEKIAIACGMRTPLSPAEQEEILSRIRK